MKGEEVMEWKTQRYEGSVGVDGRWVVSRSEAESRLEAAERELTEVSESLQAESNDNYEAWQKAEATLAAVREVCRKYDATGSSWQTQEILALLEGEEK